MAGNNNSKFLFRNPGIDLKSLSQLPVDLAAWLNGIPSGGGSGGRDNSSGGASISGGGSGDGSNSAFPLDYYNHEYGELYEGGGPGLTALQPQILAVSKQEVVQDPQGNATVTVTLSIGPEQENMEYELRLTKA